MCTLGENLQVLCLHKLRGAGGACEKGGACVCVCVCVWGGGGNSRAKGQTKKPMKRQQRKYKKNPRKSQNKNKHKWSQAKASCPTSRHLCAWPEDASCEVCKWTWALSDNWVANFCRHSRSRASRLSTGRRISMRWCNPVLSGKSTTWSWRLHSLSSGARRVWTAPWHWPFPRAWRSSNGRWTAAWTDLWSTQSTLFDYLVRWSLPSFVFVLVLWFSGSFYIFGCCLFTCFVVRPSALESPPPCTLAHTTLVQHVVHTCWQSVADTTVHACFTLSLTLNTNFSSRFLFCSYPSDDRLYSVKL